MNIETIIVGPIEVNCYIVSCPKTAVAAVIDPGENADDILQYLQSNTLDLKTILLTHGHFDHIGAVVPLKQATNATVAMHKADQPLVDIAQQQSAAFGLQPVQPFKADHYVDDGDSLEVGTLQAQVIHTPGHSPGGISFLFKNDLFAGDTLFYGGVGRTDLPGGSMSTLVNSIKSKLFTLPESVTVYSGHGPTTTIGREKKYNPFTH